MPILCISGIWNREYFPLASTYIHISYLLLFSNYRNEPLCFSRLLTDSKFPLAALRPTWITWRNAPPYNEGPCLWGDFDMRNEYFCGVSALAVALTIGAWSTGAWADTANDGTVVREVEVVAPTGSYIRQETTALPVDVVSSQDLQRQGSPSVVQLVKTITASASGLGESNRYNGGAGTASINLRGFGASRTLVLFNGRRMPDSTAAAFQGGGVNLNSIPTAAVGRIDILKDGAAATYGSEAIGGVVNFITRTDLNGFDVNAQDTGISGSDGDY